MRSSRFFPATHSCWIFLQLFLAGLCLIAFFCREIEDDTFFIHLATGRHIYNMGNVPATDPLSYNTVPDSYRAYWLSQLLFYLAATFLGINQLLLIPTCLYAILFSLFFFSLREKRPSLLGWWGIFFTIAGYPFYQNGQLDYMAHFCALLMLWNIVAGNYSWKCWLYCALLQFFWCHAHPMFLLGPLTLGTYWLGLKWQSAANFLSYRFLLLLCGCSLLSPFGLRIFDSLYYWTALHRTTDIWLWSGLWAVMLLGLILLWKSNRQRLASPRFMVLILWMGVSIIQPHWMLPTIFLMLTIVFNAASPIVKFRYANLATGILLLLLPLTIYSRTPGPGINTDKVPINATLFLKNIDAPGNIFHDTTYGGCIAWGSDKKIFCDRRSWLYPSSLVCEIKRLQSNPQSFLSLARRFNIQLSIVEHQQYPKRSFLLWLSSQPQWHLIYCDHLVAIFVKSHLQLVDIIEKYQIYDSQESPLTRSGDKNGKSIWRAYMQARALAFMNFHQRVATLVQNREPPPSLRSLHFFLLGKLALLDGDHDLAQKHLRKSWQFAPTPETLALLIETCLQIGSPASIAECAMWIKQAHILPSSQRLMYQAQLAQLQGKLAQAVMLLKTLIKGEPQHQHARQYLQDLQEQIRNQSLAASLSQAQQMLKRQQFQQAIALLKQTIDRDAKCAKAYLQLGRIYLQIKNYTQAIECLRMALSIVPGEVTAICYLAQALAYSGQWKEALQIILPLHNRKQYQNRYDVRNTLALVDDIAIIELQNYTAKHPDDHVRIMQFVALLMRQKKFATAIKIMNKIPNLNSQKCQQLATLHYLYGKQLINQRRVEQGLKQLALSVDIAPDFCDAHLLLGAIALKTKNWDKATSHFRKLRQLAPEDERGYYGLALVELGQGITSQLRGEYNQAVAKFDLYLRKAPDSPEKNSIQKRIANLRKMRSYLKQKDKQRQAKKYFIHAVKAMEHNELLPAIQLFQQAITIQPKFVEAHYNLGQAYLRQKNFSASRQTLQRTVELRNYFPNAHFTLGWLYYRAVDMQRAKHHLQLYLQQSPQGKFVTRAKNMLRSLHLMLPNSNLDKRKPDENQDFPHK